MTEWDLARLPARTAGRKARKAVLTRGRWVVAGRLITRSSAATTIAELRPEQPPAHALFIVGVHNDGADSQQGLFPCAGQDRSIDSCVSRTILNRRHKTEAGAEKRDRAAPERSAHWIPRSGPWRPEAHGESGRVGTLYLYYRMGFGDLIAAMRCLIWLLFAVG